MKNIFKKSQKCRKKAKSSGGCTPSDPNLEPTTGMFPCSTAGSELALRRSFLPPNLVLLHPPPLTFLPCAPAAIPTSKRSRLHSYANHISDTAAMRGSRMRPVVVKVEDGVGGAVADEGLQPEADAGRPWQRRRLSEAGAAVSDEALSRRAYLEAQALAVEGMERTRVLGEELLQAKALNAELKAEVRIKDGIIHSKDEALQSKDALLQAKDAIIQSKDDQLQAKDVIIQSKDDQLQQAKDAQLRLHPAGMAPFNPDSAAVGAARQPAHAQAGGGVAAAAAAADSVFQEGQRLYGEQRYSDAAQRWGQAARSKHAASHAFFSDMLVDGRPGVAKDAKRAFKLAKAGAALGCAHSKGALGRCYLSGHGVAENEGKGLALGRESEAAGSCFGQYVVGVCYRHGWGVAQDHAEAMRLYRLAAAQVHAHDSAVTILLGI